MQRRTTNAATAMATAEVPVASAPSHQNTTTPLKGRRKVRRRRKSPLDMGEVQSLVLVAIVTAFLTASLVWLFAKGYTTLVYRKHNEPSGHHRHHHLHAQRNEHKNPQDTLHDLLRQRESPGEADDDYDVLPWNPIYRVPEAMETLGDRSDEYARVRKEIDQIVPPDPARSMARLQEITQVYPSLKIHAMTAEHSDEVVEKYDIYNCPDEPPKGYPFEWKLAEEVLASWPVTQVDDIPQNRIHQGLCVFDYQKDYQKALAYREAELPFVVINDPDVARTVERWNIPGYLNQILGKDVKHRAEYNTNSHFLYHQPRRPKKKRHGNPEPDNNEPLQDLQGRTAELQRQDVVPQNIRMTYDEWLAKANKTHVGTEEEHWYFRLIGCGYMDNEGNCDMGTSEYLYDEMPYFQPRNDNRNALYLGEPKEQKGVHCRFGMKGVIAENHFDASRNAIVILGGRRRYILSHPRQCENLALLPKEHESGRHSEVDYANPDLDRFPEFAEARGNEVVLEAGQVLYLPTHWFHYIVSLDLNYQCNTRSGITHHYHSYIRECGF